MNSSPAGRNSGTAAGLVCRLCAREGHTPRPGPHYNQSDLRVSFESFSVINLTAVFCEEGKNDVIRIDMKD